LVDLYYSSDFLWFVSISEGFGLPIIEAQALGVTVITTKGSAMSWVGGSGAVFISNPFDVIEIKNKILEVMLDINLKRKITKLGSKNIQRFSFINFRDAYLDLFNSLSV
jgi:glycosyltransferase involved in cell wall biosynthesis